MRALAAAALIALTPVLAAAEAMPSGAIGVVSGGVAGTGADAKRLGFGYHVGLQASWQPTTTDQTWGPTLRWATMFGRLYTGNAVQIDSALHTVQMDLLLGVRFRPWSTPKRYLTVRAGGQLLRANEPIPRSNEPDAHMQRSFVGAIASVGIDQYLAGFMFNVDVRYGLIGSGPAEIALLIGFGLTGP